MQGVAGPHAVLAGVAAGLVELVDAVGVAGSRIEDGRRKHEVGHGVARPKEGPGDALGPASLVVACELGKHGAAYGLDCVGVVLVKAGVAEAIGREHVKGGKELRIALVAARREAAAPRGRGPCGALLSVGEHRDRAVVRRVEVGLRKFGR